MSQVTIIQCSKEELFEIVKQAVREEAARLPRKRDKPYTREEVRHLFDTSFPTIYRWENKGYLERIQNEEKGRVYFTAESVQALLRKK